MSIKESNRLQSNKAILAVLTQYIETNPTVRFSQALFNLNIVTDSGHRENRFWIDEYYTEPEEILKRMK